MENKMKLALPEIKDLVDQLAAKISAPQNSLPTYGYSEQSGRHHVEVHSSGYHLVAAERVTEFKRYVTSDIDDLLYNIFEGVTFWLACQYERAHRVEDQDCRRIIFQHQVELLSRLSPQWAEREAQEHDQILLKHPLHDLASIRATLYGKLREQGFSEEAIDKIAYQQYRLPKRNLGK